MQHVAEGEYLVNEVTLLFLDLIGSKAITIDAEGMSLDILLCRLAVVLEPGLSLSTPIQT